MGERRVATYDDVLAAGRDEVAELIGGILHTSPRPRLTHAAVSTVLSEELGPPFRRGRGGPGGWLILFEPEIHLGGDVLVPDLAGWRRERLQTVPDAAFAVVAPDWACEVLSPSTAAFDRRDKLGVYARERVGHVWLIDPATRILEVLRLDGEGYRVAAIFVGDDEARAEPFEAIVLPLSALWNG